MSDSKKNFSKTNLSWNIFISLWSIHGKLSTNAVEFNYFHSGVHWVKIVSESIFAKVICRPLLPVFLRYPLCKTCLVKRRTGTSLIKFFGIFNFDKSVVCLDKLGAAVLIGMHCSSYILLVIVFVQTYKVNIYLPLQ